MFRKAGCQVEPLWCVTHATNPYGRAVSRHGASPGINFDKLDIHPEYLRRIETPGRPPLWPGSLLKMLMHTVGRQLKMQHSAWTVSSRSHPNSFNSNPCLLMKSRLFCPFHVTKFSDLYDTTTMETAVVGGF